MPHSFFRRSCGAAAIFCVSAIASAPTLARSAGPCTSAVLTLPETAELLRIETDELQQLAERAEVPARRVGNAWRFSCAAIMSWLNGDWSPAPPARSSDRPPLGATELGKIAGAGQNAGNGPEDGPSATDLDDEPIGDAPQVRTAEDVLLRDQRVLVGPRDVSLNLGQFYSENTSLILASTAQGDALAALEQEALLTSFQARIGFGRDSEMFLATSYAHQNNDLLLVGQRLTNSDASDFGDAIVGFRRTLSREGVRRSNIIGTLTAHVPTGDGPYAISAGAGFLKSFDPVALFASVSYTRTFNEDLADITLLRPEHRLDTNLGFALALNDTLSLSGAVSAAFTGATRFANASLRQQDSYSLGFGLTSRVSRRIYLEPAVSFGLGGPTDGFALGLSLFTFKQ